MPPTAKHFNIYQDVLAHFLTDFSINEPPRKLELYLTPLLHSTYAHAVVDDFVAQSLDRLKLDLVNEYNHRSINSGSIRYSFADDDCKVGSRDIREFVGSSRLAALKIYSKFDERYEHLDIRPFAPVALVFVTTQEVPRTVKHMARSAGIVVLTSDDLCPLFLAKVESI